MRLTTLALTLALALPFSHAALADEEDISKVNGTVQVEAGRHVGDASTVNGSVRLGARAVVARASSVNGSVELGEGAQAQSVRSVNGAVTLQSQARITGKLSTTNGSIRLQNGSQVGGDVSNVNGRIALEAARVGGGLSTVSGDILVGADSTVDGGILVDKPSGWFSSDARDPEVVIGPHAVVKGTLEFRRKVELHVSDSAQIGPVKGATVQKFSGAQP